MMKTKKRSLKRKTHIRRNIIMVVGAGAVENAWLPVLKALEPIIHANATADMANCFFARCVYLLRYYATGTFEGKEEGYKRIVAFTTDLKMEIARFIRFAQEKGYIDVRKELLPILQRFIFPAGVKAAFITTNWDTILDDVMKLVSRDADETSEEPTEVLHVHGSVLHPESLYLPSELIREPYREKAEDTRMGANHVTMVHTVQKCDTTILYGLSLDPLDAELSQMLAKGWQDGDIREIVVIDPAHELVARRAKILLAQSSKARICGYDPADLDKEHVHFE